MNYHFRVIAYINWIVSITSTMGSTTYSRWLDVKSDENEWKEPKSKVSISKHLTLRKVLGVVSGSELNSRSGNVQCRLAKMPNFSDEKIMSIKLENRLKGIMNKGKDQQKLYNIKQTPERKCISRSGGDFAKKSFKYLQQFSEKMKEEKAHNSSKLYKDAANRCESLKKLGREVPDRKKLKTGGKNKKVWRDFPLSDSSSDYYEKEDVRRHRISNDEGTVVPMSPQWDETIEKELEAVVYKMYRSEPDPEDEDTWDVSMVAEYAPEIFNHLRDLETKYAPYPYYIPQIQSEITWDNRATLVNWIVQVHSRFGLLPETLYLTVNIIDRFLSKRPISLSKFQLCGAVALFIAAKYEEINCPTVKQIAYMISNQYTTTELLKAERFMITDIDFDMGYPGPMSFLRRTSKADNYDTEIRTLAKYFLEITIMDSRFVAAPPSWLAAGASYLSLKMLHHGEWTEAHVYYSGYTEAQLRPLAEILIDCCLNYKTHHKAIFDKYASRRFKRSSLFVQDYLERELYR